MRVQSPRWPRLHRLLGRPDRQDEPETETQVSTWQTHGGIEDVRQARALVWRTVRDQSQATRDAAVLLVDECVANAVRHGGGEFEMIVQRGSGTLRVEVVDQSPEFPVPLAPDPECERGRGLTIVNDLASRWGTNGLGHGKVVWFELSLD